MSNKKMDSAGALPLANGIGFVFGLIGVVAIFIQQSLAVFFPLLLPPTVCARSFVFSCTGTQQPTKESSDSPNPIRFDVI